MERKVLGKGLDALIPKKTESLLPKEFSYLPLDKVVPSQKQPRQKVEQKELEELTQSIKEKGFLQPIVVRKSEAGMYQIVAGERRYLASKLLGLKEIPAIIKDVNERDAFVLAIVENLQRTNLNPIEEARAFSRLVGEFEFSLSDIAQFVGKDKTTIVNAIRLMKLPEHMQQALQNGLITRTQARAILSIEKPGEQEKLFNQILKGGLSVRDIEKKARLASAKKRKIDPFVLEMEEKLQTLLGTKVKISHKRNNRGRIIIEYYSVKDLERILKRLY